MANLVVEYVEESAFQQFTHNIKFYRRYVDDTFVILNRNLLDEFHSTLNSIEPPIQFTYELEQEKRLPFLDVSVPRLTTRLIQTSVYRKPCDTGNFLNFESYHPTEHKSSVVRTLLQRCEDFASCPEQRTSEEMTIKESLMERGYPLRFFENTRKRMHEPRTRRKDDFRRGIVTIPYVNGVSESGMGINTLFGY
ncbi:uncharacterized protein LOC135385021 [Ornithodoros turicata]|uniref:uncharacterized protein LOC135385021 n=1 Tax=Ornithodoros turicata TaxID=34597 RepID=UPI003139726B